MIPNEVTIKDDKINFSFDIPEATKELIKSGVEKEKDLDSYETKSSLDVTIERMMTSAANIIDTQKKDLYPNGDEIKCFWVSDSAIDTDMAKRVRSDCFRYLFMGNKDTSVVGLLSPKIPFNRHEEMFIRIWELQGFSYEKTKLADDCKDGKRIRWMHEGRFCRLQFAEPVKKRNDVSGGKAFANVIIENYCIKHQCGLDYGEKSQASKDGVWLDVVKSIMPADWDPKQMREGWELYPDVRWHMYELSDTFWLRCCYYRDDDN